jgi:cell division protein FtsW (lipid II flippase)
VDFVVVSVVTEIGIFSLIVIVVDVLFLVLREINTGVNAANMTKILSSKNITQVGEQ